MKKIRKLIKYYLIITFVLLSFYMQAQTTFTPGNFVVCRIGDGTSVLSSTAAPVFLDEFTAAGVLVQSVQLPTAVAGSNKALTLNGNSFLGGLVSLSANSQHLLVTGFDAPSGTTTVASTTADVVARTIGVINYDAMINSTTALTDFSSSSNPICAVSTDGINIWACGNGSVNNTAGIHYATIGASTSLIITSGDQTNRNLNISNGQLYATQFTPKLGSVGTGIPTTTGQTITNLPGFPTTTQNLDQFVFFDFDPNIPGLDVLYIANDRSDGGIQKYSLVGGNWTYNGKIGTTTDTYTGITGIVSGGTATLYATRLGTNSTSVRGGEMVKVTDATGYNATISGNPTVLSSILLRFGANNVATYRGVALVPQPSTPKVSVKMFLQGAYNSGLSRHKDVTATWASILNANALNQPYNTAAFGNYSGTESVASGFFTSTGGTTDILDWVLLELRDQTTPSTVIARRAAFVREDGNVVDLDGTSAVKFTNVVSGSYYLVILHRNHLPVRTSITLALDGNVYSNTNTTLYDCTIAQSQAYQNPAVTTNTAMKDFGNVSFGMWAGNANSNASVRASGAPTQNDYLYLVNTLLGGNTATILSNVYSSGDVNLDGVVRASGSPTVNDYLILVNTILGGNTATIVNEHQ